MNKAVVLIVVLVTLIAISILTVADGIIGNLIENNETINVDEFNISDVTKSEDVSNVSEAPEEKSADIINDTIISPEIWFNETMLEGYMISPSGDPEYFIFGAIRLNETDTSETEWSNPIFYFKFNDKTIIMGTTSYYYFLEEKSDGTLEHLPILREIWSTSSDFELDFVFTKSGEIDISQSSIGIVPDQYKTGRNINQLTWNGEYYKKGNKTELFVPIRDDEDKVINQNEAGEPVIEEMSVHVLDVCYKEIIGRDIYYLKTNLGNLTYRNSTGLCPIYKIQNISRIPDSLDAYKFKLIKSEATSSPPSNITILDEEDKESQPSYKSEYITSIAVLPPLTESMQVINPIPNKLKGVK